MNNEFWDEYYKQIHIHGSFQLDAMPMKWNQGFLVVFMLSTKY